MNVAVWPAAVLVALLSTAGSPEQAPQAAAPEPPKVGEPAPSIRLNDHQGKAVLLPGGEDQEGHDWVVLAFYPKAATPG
jgi:hypothetical protein